MLLFVRPFIMRLLEEIRNERALSGTLMNAEPINALIAEPTRTLESPEALALAKQNQQEEEEASKRSTAQQEVKNMIDNHPQETVNIIRNWMSTPVAERS
jgi:flagellar biosynthesis/type III secretory pathway M-ring protein FliF/YscJ